MLRHKIAIILSLLLMVQHSHGQKLQASLSHYSTDDGLASNAIAQITQDDYGFIWIATWNGVTRFDGYNFYNYKTGNGSHIPLLHNRIFQLLPDQQQNVWMRMYDGRIFVIDRKHDVIVNPFEGVGGSDEYRTNIPIFLTSSGNVLVSIQEVGMYLLKFDNNKIDMQLITTTGMNITCMAEGYHNDIWVGTDNGVHRLDIGNLTLERKGMFEDEGITALYSNGYNIWAGTRSGSIYLFSYGQESKRLREPSGQEISSLLVDSRGIIWFGDPRYGISRIKDGNEKLFQQKVLAPEYDSFGGYINEANGIVWVRMNHGGYGYYDRESDEVEYFHNDPSNPWNLSNTVNAALELPEGVVFLSTNRRGLEKLEILKNTITRKRLVDNPQSSTDNEIRGMLYDAKRKKLLLANKSNTLFIFNGDSSRTVITKDSKGNPIGRTYGIASDSKGNYWLSSKDYGLFKITPGANGYDIQRFCQVEGDKWSLSSDKAYLSVEDHQGNIWVATYGGGVNVLTRNKEGKQVILNHTNTIRRYPHNSYQKVRTIAVDQEGTVWAGTTDGILLLSMKNGQVEVRKLGNSTLEPDKILMSNDIVCLACDKDGAMWLGTNGGGLSRTVGKDDEGNWLFETYDASNGLPSEEIRSITFDSRGNVWFATDHTLCSFDIEKKIFTTFSNLDGVDETMCSEGAAVCLPNDDVIFGTVDGYYLVERKKLVNDNASMLKLHITDFFINDELVTPRNNSEYDYYVPESKKVVLPHHNMTFGFRFAAMNYQLQHRIHYQYMLEGFDHEWQNTNDLRMAHYANVPTGKYRFVVKAFLLESPDKFDMRSIEVEIPPHFMLTKKAIWIYMALALALGLGLMFWRENHIRKKLSKMKILKMGPQQMAFADEGDYNFVKAQYDWLEQHYADANLTTDDLVTQAGMSRTEYHTRLKKLTEFSPKEFIADFRAQKGYNPADRREPQAAEATQTAETAGPTAENPKPEEQNTDDYEIIT